MILTIQIEDKQHFLDIPAEMVVDGSDFFDKIDADMDNGWMMSREYVEDLNVTQRCQVVADRILGAVSQENDTLCHLMGAYIISRLPDVVSIDVDVNGEMMNTRFEQANKPVAVMKMSTEEARERAEKEISNVYKVGRVFKYSLHDPVSDKWIEYPAFDNKDAAEQQRAELIEAKIVEWSQYGLRDFSG